MMFWDHAKPNLTLSLSGYGINGRGEVEVLREPSTHKVCVRDERTLALSIMRCKQLRIVSLKTVNEELLKGCLRVYPIT